MPDLHKSLQRYTRKTSTVNTPLSGSLGITPTCVNVPTRPGFSYVRLLGNTSELIEAYNATVYPEYDIPVRVQWDGRKYVVIGRDVNRYSSWNPSAYLPLHGDTHQWNGGDTTWIHSEQFLPLSVSPSGSSLYIAPGQYDWLGNWVSAGGVCTTTGVLPSNPTKQSILLLYLDGPTGNPTWITGTEAPLYTDRSLLLPYLPAFSPSLGVPLAMVAIPSGTTSFGWNNLYDVRQFFVGGGGATSHLYVDQAGGTSPTYGVLAGARNGVNTTFTVSQAQYTSGNLVVYLNGQQLPQTDNWHETSPTTGTFDMVVAPSATDILTAVYGALGTPGGGSFTQFYDSVILAADQTVGNTIVDITGMTLTKTLVNGIKYRWKFIYSGNKTGGTGEKGYTK